MKHEEAVALLEGAVPRGRGTWADLGCGDGVFTEGLVELLGTGSRIYAIDCDRRVIEALQQNMADRPEVIPIWADFTQPDIPGLLDAFLDGILLANSLHYARDAGEVLARLASLLRPGGRAVLVEYDRREANPWVPYPIGIARLDRLAHRAGLSKPVVVARQPSRFTGELYVAVADRLDHGKPV